MTAWPLIAWRLMLIEIMTHSISSPQPSDLPQSLLGRFLKFLRHPRYTVNVATEHQGVIDVLRLYALALVTVLPLGVLSSRLADNLDSSNKVLEITKTVPILQIILFAVILAPLWEEAVFRLPLRYTPMNLAIPFCIGMMLIVSSLTATDVLPRIAGLPLLAGTVVLAVVLWLWLKELDSQPIHTFYEKWIGWLFYSFALAFGLIHIGNFTSLGAQAWLLAPLLVLPQTVIGVFLGFIRLRYGFWWAVLTHGFHNACAITPLLLVRLGSENLLESMSSGIQDKSLAGTDYVLILLVSTYVLGGLLLCLITVWRLIAEWRAEHRQARPNS
ncbi:CPBP family intramembrane metalloprotease [Acaryochloris sp. 'Moss Beach']|uniref:CPBP family glutamic-type intramembrane protease n=1 Tax=Acaryochloris sp. 'Moss Beach' TaxID=2740837 RepID=UPI001F209F6C|nr:CPBP family glutamic-type intramembrane protease [Acaryochloris sp. 'Moss Beach']UJB70277.1 CPBP family intramembrane metalloprotease [Acaryochloris sp. 'Moss Beach']